MCLRYLDYTFSFLPTEEAISIVLAPKCLKSSEIQSPFFLRSSPRYSKASRHLCDQQTPSPGFPPFSTLRDLLFILQTATAIANPQYTASLSSHSLGCTWYHLNPINLSHAGLQAPREREFWCERVYKTQECTDSFAFPSALLARGANA